MGDLGSLLGRWHQWRRAWSHERGYARALSKVFATTTSDDDEQLELLIMEAIEREVELMPRELRLAVQHVARAECMGVEVLMHPSLADKEHRQSVVARAVAELQRRLRNAGVV